MCATDFIASKIVDVCPSENAGVIWAPLITCPGLRKVNTYSSDSSTKPILERHAK